MTTWRERADAFIAEAMKDAPADLPLAERKKALRRMAGTFHCGTSWGKKVWSKAARSYLAPYGYKSDREVPRRHLSPLERMMLASEKHRAKVNASLPFKEKPK